MKRKKNTNLPLKTLLIVTATEAEAVYFSQVRKDCRYTNLHVEWASEATGLKSLILFANLRRRIGKYDTVWTVFGLNDYALSFDDIRAHREFAEQKKVHMAWVYPTFSLWYLFHGTLPDRLLTSAEAIDRDVARLVPGYDPTAYYLLTDGQAFHLKLFPSKARAGLNASAYSERQAERLGFPATNLPLLINEISEYCGLADITHNQKQIGLKNN
ncbi:RloB domain-containing protein [Parasphaerochaeta coccoides]|uniref:RloB-like protein n=1 Tax=Parasphaerochaeta coccoides (strain ATCC BAA-1237 / DSM 17374 / SPN1) TaxID=760011 RepID=F4GJE4_PARC1|nr:RloB domain-containing protein [Parasphaerochaeta coccoides]AEC02209.1 hypothetical protein Spico_0985 [Parasphaerochaeta coccoides DSM 17374]